MIETPTLEGIPVLAIYSRSPWTKWGVVIGIPQQVFKAQLTRTFSVLGLGFGTLLVICLALAWFIGRRIARSFQALVSPADALGAGENVLLPPVEVKEAALVSRAIGKAAYLLEKRNQELQRSETRFRATFDQAAVGIAHVSLEGNWLLVNDRLCNIVGYGAEELPRLTFQDITHPDDLMLDLAHMQQLLDGNIPSYSMEKRYIRKDRSPVWINLTASLVRTPTGEPDYFISVIEDVQRRKEVEAALEKEQATHRQELEKQVAERTAELEAANREVEAFTFAASHDLRGPLGRINSFSSMLERNYRERLDGDGLMILDLIRQNATRLTLLVDDLISHARIAQKALELQPINIQAAVASVIQEKADDIEEKKAEVHIDLPPVQILADPHAFSQALGNLVENALKYSSQTATPQLHIGGESLGNRFRLWVRDNGIGFKMEYHDKIFKMFQRLHTYTEYAGSGVGLALVKRAMERMEGKVWAESQPDQGATFFLELKAVA